MTASGLGGRIALITGASSGIGRAVALALANEHVRLCLTARSAERLEAVAAAARAAGAEACICAADLCADADVSRLSAYVAGQFDRLDILIHSAGTIAVACLATARIEDLDRQYRTNVRGPYLLTQRLLPLVLSCGGQIVFINSSAALRARRTVSQYAATKHALKAIADSLREEVADRGVRVLSIFPGNTATPMQAALHAEQQRPYDPSRYMDPDELALLLIATLRLRSAEVKGIDLRPLGG